MEEDDEQISTGENRGSLTFLEDDDQENGGASDALVDKIQVLVLSCNKEGNDYSYKIKVGVAGCEFVTCFYLACR